MKNYRSALIATLLLIISGPAFLWACGAFYYDSPSKIFACVYVVLIGGVLFFFRLRWQSLAAFGVSFALILGWWFTLTPSNDRDWHPDVAQLAWEEIKGDEVTLHNVRNCEYRSESDYTPRWETRTVRLSQITGLDIAVCYWGSPWIAHQIASFQFADAPPVCFSVETRKEEGELYSSIGGFYRQYELIYVVADERDVIRVRTNYREGEDVYLYRTNFTVDQVRERFMVYVKTLNEMRDAPIWYNALTNNCTTSIRAEIPAAKRSPWDWRIVVNGKGDKLMYDRGAIATEGLPFEELKKRAHINTAAQAVNDARDFSRRIREGLPGF